MVAKNSRNPRPHFRMLKANAFQLIQKPAQPGNSTRVQALGQGISFPTTGQIILS